MRKVEPEPKQKDIPAPKQPKLSTLSVVESKLESAKLSARKLFERKEASTRASSINQQSRANLSALEVPKEDSDKQASAMTMKEDEFDTARTHSLAR